MHGFPDTILNASESNKQDMRDLGKELLLDFTDTDILYMKRQIKVVRCFLLYLYR